MGRPLGDWKLAGGFSALLFLVVVIGFIGIIRIQSLGKTIDDLGTRYFPMQNSALEMRINNNLYAIGIRNYMFWKSAKYLEAAKDAASEDTIQSAIESFDRQLSSYSSFAERGEQELWVEKIQALQLELRAIGEKIIFLVDTIDNTAIGPKKTGLESSLDRQVMAFENKLFRIDDFLESSVQKSNLEAVKEQLLEAALARKRAIVFLGWSLIFGLVIGGETAWLVYWNRRRDRERREDLVRRMIKVEEEERENLSRQVHDQMGQDLSGLKIYLDIIDEKVPPESAEAKKDIIEGKRILTGLIDKSHNISELLRPPALDEIGLVDTIEGLIFQYRQMTGINFSYQKPETPLKLSGEYSLILYRAAQEALTNIVKHAEAKNVGIKLGIKNKVVRLSIQDDGKGFDYKDFLQQPHRRREDRMKLGLLGLKERVELLSGSMDIKSAHGKGMRLVVQLPAQIES